MLRNYATRKVVLLITFIGPSTYLYGANNIGSRFQLLWRNFIVPSYANKRDIEKAINELQYLLREDTISIDNNDLLIHVPYLGGLSLETNFSAPYRGISINFTNIDEIISLNTDDKSAVGYNLINLFIGSEGTLGLVTEITLKLIVIPKETSVAIVIFPTIRDIAAAALKVIRVGVPVAAMEIIDKKEVLTIFFKFSGTKAGLVKSITKTHKTLYNKEGMEVSKKEMDDLGLTASILGYIKDGNFHKSILYDSKNIKERAAVEKCINNMVNRALEIEGTYTSKHRIKLGKKESLLKELRLETIGIIKSIKGALDPY
ncbi:FAD-linked oxidase-like protein [Cenococcum geophilum]